MFALLKKTQLKTLLMGMIFFALFFFVAHRFWFGAHGMVDSVASCFWYPLITVQRYTLQPVKRYLQDRSSLASLRAEHAALQQEYNRLLEENIAMHSAARYEEKTEGLREYAKRYNMQRAHVAQVLLQHHDAHSHHILVNAGSAHGIETDMVAVVKNCLVGRVVQVFPYHSKVVLIIDEACKVAAHCARSHSEGIYQGSNDREGRLRFVSHLASVSKNDLVVTSGKGMIFPEGFAIGYVDNAVKNGLEYDISVRPLMNCDDLDYCYLVKKGQIE